MNLLQIASALGGNVTGRQVAAPTPGHSPHDRSMVVRVSATAPDGFIVHGFAGENFRELRDYVRERLGGARPQLTPNPMPSRENAMSRVRLARKVWRDANPARGTIVEKYLGSRGLELPPDANEVIRFCPAGAWNEGDVTVYVPMMVAAMRSTATGEVMATHRTRLTPGGQKVDRRMLGVAAGAAIMINRHEGDELAIAEGVESALASRQLGFLRVWALGSAGAIGAFEVLPNVQILHLLAENDVANEKAVRRCASRWHAAFRRVRITTPNVGNDMNDVLRAAAGAG